MEQGRALRGFLRVVLNNDRWKLVDKHPNSLLTLVGKWNGLVALSPRCTAVTCPFMYPILTFFSWLSHFPDSYTHASWDCLRNRVSYSDSCFFQKQWICSWTKTYKLQLKIFSSHCIHCHHPGTGAQGTIISYLDYCNNCLIDLPEPIFHMWARMYFIKHKSYLVTRLLKTLWWFPITL